jgi:hypothetical protein
MLRGFFADHPDGLASVFCGIFWDLLVTSNLNY